MITVDAILYHSDSLELDAVNNNTNGLFNYNQGKERKVIEYIIPVTVII